MFVRRLGSANKSPVLVLHGQLFDGRIMAPIAAGLAQQHLVLVPDLPGYGNSPIASGDLLEVQFAALLSLILDERFESLAIVGFSLGAYHGIRLALELGRQIDRLVLLGAVAGLNEPEREGMGAFASLIERKQLGPEQMDRLVAERMFSTSFSATNPERVKAALSIFREVSLAHLARELRAISTLRDLRPALGAVRAKTYLWAGAQDVATPAKLAKEIASAIPGARLSMVEGGTHLLWQEKPQIVQAICAVLEDVSDR